MTIEESCYKLYQWRALSPHVLVVASIDIRTNKWTAYIGAVPGNNHDKEYKQVAETGNKLVFPVAAIYFPTLNEKYLWRD
jgi:hypothetical protein